MKPGYAFVIPWPITLAGGVNHVIHHLARESKQEGRYEPIYFESSWQHQRPEIDEVSGIRRVRVRMRAPIYEGRWAPEYLAFLPAEIAKWRRLIRDHRIAVVNPYFLSLQQLAVAVLRAGGLFDGKFIVTYQGSDVRTTLAAPPAERRLLRWILHCADAIVPCSRGLGEELLDFDRSLARKFRPILNGVSGPEFLACRDPQFDAAALIPPGRRLVLNVAAYQYRKGHDLLLNAFSEISKRIDDLHLAIVGGSGPELDRTRQQVARLNLDNRVSLLVNEPYDRIPAYMAISEVFVLTSRWVKGKMGEGLPLALLEAGVAGVPVVSTASTGVDEVVTDGVHGRVVPVEDTAALAKALADVLADPVAARRRADLLRTRLAAEFTWASRWRLYSRLSDGQRLPGPGGGPVGMEPGVGRSYDPTQ